MPSLVELMGQPPQQREVGALESILNAVVPSAQGAEKTRQPRAVLRNGKIYDLGVEISPQEAQASIQRAQQSLLKNAQQLQSAPPGLKQAMQPAHDLAKQMLEEGILDLQNALGSMKK